jgi:hypothetical protein
VPAGSGGLEVPVTLRPVVSEIVACTDAVCEAHLDLEYRELCRRLVGRLARKRPSPLSRGDPTIWAAGVIHVIGSINFLFDRSQVPYVGADELAERVGVAKSSMANKSAMIRKLLELSWLEPELTRRSMLERNPLAWLVMLNGVPVDARTLPLELQKEARLLGLIPDLDDRRAA